MPTSTPPHITIVLSDAPAARVDQGGTLANFVRLWQPARCTVVTSEALLAEPPRETDLALIGLPTLFGDAHRDRLRARQYATFDYFDAPEPYWAESEAELLRSLSTLHLKTHRRALDQAQSPIGLLPIRYNKAVTAAYLASKLALPWRSARRVGGFDPRPWDVSLQGSTTYLDTLRPDGTVDRYEQRIEWSFELQAHSTWRHWGGLLPIPYRTEADIVRTYGLGAASLFATGPRIPFGRYFRQMTQTKVALCPTGHARWTYRHVESVYAGCDVVSTDLLGIDTLVPIPGDCFVLVADRAPITPAVEETLARWEERRGARRAARAALEGWLMAGRFSRLRRRPYERFLSQFNL